MEHVAVQPSSQPFSKILQSFDDAQERLGRLAPLSADAGLSRNLGAALVVGGGIVAAGAVALAAVPAAPFVAIAALGVASYGGVKTLLATREKQMADRQIDLLERGFGKTGTSREDYITSLADREPQDNSRTAGEKRWSIGVGLSHTDVPAVLHRSDGPAVERDDGSYAYYRYGIQHRDDGPAVRDADGGLHYFRDGLLHRDNGPAEIEPSGYCEWYRNGERHRDDGPAIQFPDGRVQYYRHDVEHTPDGVPRTGPVLMSELSLDATPEERAALEQDCALPGMSSPERAARLDVIRGEQVTAKSSLSDLGTARGRGASGADDSPTVGSDRDGVSSSAVAGRLGRGHPSMTLSAAREVSEPALEASSPRERGGGVER